MGKLSDFLAGIKILKETDSKYNGKITVVKSIAFGTYFQVGGLTQSGGIIKNIWNHSLKKVATQKKETSKILVLGLGGGSIIGVLRKYWPDAKITAVDIDPVIVKLGKEYLGLDDKNIKVVISDAFDFLTTHYSLHTTGYDLICIDLYVGDQFPEKFETLEFPKLVKNMLNTGGIAVFNRLYYGDKRPKSVKFIRTLERVFSNVEVSYPEANIMLITNK